MTGQWGRKVAIATVELNQITAAIACQSLTGPVQHLRIDPGIRLSKSRLHLLVAVLPAIHTQALGDIVSIQYQLLLATATNNADF